MLSGPFFVASSGTDRAGPSRVRVSGKCWRVAAFRLRNALLLSTFRPNWSVGDCHAHRAGGPLDDLHCRLDVVGVQIRELSVGDFPHLIPGDLADLVPLGDSRALGHAGCLLDQLRGRRRLGDERERAVLVDGDLDGDHRAAHGFGRGVVRLDELHDVHAVRPEGGTDGRRRGGGRGVQGNLDEGRDLLLGRHSGWILLLGCCWRLPAAWSGSGRSDPVDVRVVVADHTFWTWGKVRSTGVSRPRISTSAFSRWLLTLISVIVAWTPANGPSTTMTESPTTKSATSTFLRRRVGPSLVAVAAARTAGASIFSTSS